MSDRRVEMNKKDQERESNKFQCSSCCELCTLEFGSSDWGPHRCPVDSVADSKCSWERVEVEQSTEGDSMHVPVIHESKTVAAEPEKKWEYGMRKVDGYVEINAVDSQTGSFVAFLYRTGPEGELRLANRVLYALELYGYTSQGLKFDDFGRIKYFLC